MTNRTFRDDDAKTTYVRITDVIIYAFPDTGTIHRVQKIPEKALPSKPVHDNGGSTPTYMRFLAVFADQIAQDLDQQQKVG